MRNLTICVVLTLLCIAIFTGQSADTPKPLKIEFDDVEVINPKFRVKVSVTCEDDNTKSLIESYIKRELRSLQDVEIIDTKHGFVIDIVAIEMEYEVSGNKTGYMAYAYRFSRSASLDDLPVITNYFSENREKIPVEVRANLVNLYRLSEHYGMWIRFFKTKDLKSECEQLVANFDTGILEPDRISRD